MQITLIRHLPTEWNQKTWLQGRRDIEILPINEEIRLKIDHNRMHLIELEPFERVLASTLKRTHQTANLYGFEAGTEPLLDELDFGEFEGVPKRQMIEIVGNQWFENPSKLVLGEKLVALEARVVSFIEKYQNVRNLLVFGHGSWMRAFLSYMEYGHINEMNKIIVGNNQMFTTAISVRNR